MRMSSVRHAARDSKGSQQEVQREGDCTVGCGACCKFLTINVNPDYYTSEDAKAWVELHGIRVRMSGGVCWMDIPTPCSALTDDGRCGIYGKPERPKGCDTFPQSQAEINLVDDFTGEKVCTYSFKRGGEK